jgi:sterol desaturase/sphingolipid hydroxylase (fatty acid hydroxylase superfamily)
MTNSLDAQLWTALLRRPDSSMKKRLLEIWTAFGVVALIALAWAEPVSARLLPAWTKPVVMFARGVLLVEAFGYAYHRFFQHVGWLTRKSATVRRNQMFHWLHHMVIYPMGPHYKRDTGYVASETGLATSWTVPGMIVAGLALWTHGLSLGAFAFVAGIACYAKFIVDETHSRFHLVKHAWKDRAYFKRLADIHLLHHWDQANNFTIVHPLMDRLFGTFLDPDAHRAELDAVVAEDSLTFSDATNWRYMLKEASPAEYAAYITQAKRHPRSIRKIELMIACLDRRLALHPAEVEALDMQVRAKDLLALIKPVPAPAS